MSLVLTLRELIFVIFWHLRPSHGIFSYYILWFLSLFSSGFEIVTALISLSSVFLSHFLSFFFFSFRFIFVQHLLGLEMKCNLESLSNGELTFCCTFLFVTLLLSQHSVGLIPILLKRSLLGNGVLGEAWTLQPVIFCVSPAESYARLQTISSSILFHLKM